MVRAALDATPNRVDMQGDASNALNEISRYTLFEELSANPALRPLLRVATILYGRPSPLYTFTTHLILMVRLRVSRLRPVASIKVVFAGTCWSQ
jgi:hypothetical protein